MWLVGSEPWQLFVGQTRLGLWRSGEIAQWMERQPSDDLAMLIQGMLEPLASKDGGSRLRRPRVAAWLSGALARPFLLAPIAGIKGRLEATRFAESCAAEYTGLTGPVEVWLGDWHTKTATLAVAADKTSVDAVHQATRAGRCNLRSVQPWWNTVLCRALKLDRPVSLLAVDDLESITILGGASNEWQVAQSATRPGDAGALHSLLSRLALGEGLARSETLCARWAKLTPDASAHENASTAEGVGLGWEWLQ